MISGNLLISISFPIGVFILYSLVKRTKFFNEPINIFLINFAVVLAIFFYVEMLVQYEILGFKIKNLYTIQDNYYFNKPNLDEQITDKEFETSYITNTQGVRISKSHNKDIIFDKCDWLILGDSYTQGAQVDFDELYSTKLNHQFPNKISLNFGISGFGIREEYYLLKDLLSEYSPELVILQLCSFNDFFNVEKNHIGFLDYLAEHSDLLTTFFAKYLYQNPAELPLGRWTEPFYPTIKENEDYNIFYKNKSREQYEDLANFSKYLLKIVDLLNEKKIDLLVFLIPTKEQVYYKYFNEVISSFELNPSNLDMHFPNNLLDSLSHELNFRYLDLYEAFSSESREMFFQFDEHLNKSGHKLVSSCLSKSLSNYKSKNSIRFLSKDYYGDRYPNFSYVTGEIIFQSYRESNQEILLTDQNFNVIKRLTYNSVDEIHPTFVNDFSVIFTEGNQEKGETKICQLNILNGVRNYISTKEKVFGAIPCFSKVLNKVFFAEWEIVESGFTEPKIVSFDVYSGLKEIIVNNQNSNWRPSISSNGKLLAYISKEKDNYDLFLMDLETGVIQQLTDTPFDEWDPNFSNDSKNIVFAAFTDDSWNLFEYNLESKEKLQLTFSKGNEWDPCYYPDDKKIIFGGEIGYLRGIFSIDLTAQN